MTGCRWYDTTAAVLRAVRHEAYPCRTHPSVFAADEAAPVVTPQADEAFAQLSPEDQEVIKNAIRGIYAGDMCFAC